MPKFSATCLQDLLTAEHDGHRANRIRGYAAMGDAFVAVAQIEADDGSWFEMDATDRDHAIRLADNAVNVLGARGASCRYVEPLTGKLSRQSFYTVFATYDGTWDDIDGTPVA